MDGSVSPQYKKTFDENSLYPVLNHQLQTARILLEVVYCRQKDSQYGGGTSMLIAHSRKQCPTENNEDEVDPLEDGYYVAEISKENACFVTHHVIDEVK